MKVIKTQSLTVEEAVTHLLDMSFIPIGVSLLEMTSAYIVEAEGYLDNIREHDLTQREIDCWKLTLETASARHTFAQSLMKQLEYEINNPEDSMIKTLIDSENRQRITVESFSYWASDRLGIDIEIWGMDIKTPVPQEKDFPWERVTIKIYENHKIGCFIGDKKPINSHFRKINLMGLSKNVPNNSGTILMGLSQGKKYPSGKSIQPKHKTAISRLRRALNILTGKNSDPFYPFNENDGWKPRFKLIDDRRNADERAKKNAKHVPLDVEMSSDETVIETPDFDREDDPAQKYIDQKESNR